RPRRRGAAPQRHLARRHDRGRARGADGRRWARAALDPGGRRRDPPLAGIGRLTVVLWAGGALLGRTPWNRHGGHLRFRHTATGRGGLPMVRTPRRQESTPEPPPPPAPPPSGSDRERIIAAFLLLLAERSFDAIELVEIAARAGVPLATLRDEF